MAYTDHIVGQILAKHFFEKDLIPGKEAPIRIDQTLTQDATGTLVYQEFMSLGIPRVKTKFSISYVDHNTLQVGCKNADDHLFLQSVAARYGVNFSRPGNGICHQVHFERFSVPGQTLLGSDSHTPTAGGMGMLAIGAGGMDVALAMAGIPFHITVPKVILVRLTGKLSSWAGAKDVILYLLKKLSVKGGLGKIIEYGGPGIKNLKAPERATITNMGAELGAWTSIFPSDEETRRFLVLQGREKDWVPISAHDNAEYDEIIEIDLSTIESLVACPSSPDAVKPVSDLAGINVDQVVIGSCTNSSYHDLKLVAELLRDKKVHPNTSMVIAPGSRNVLSMLAKDGSLSNMVDAGARILEVACGPCIGIGQSPPSGSISVRTFNRNFPGRSGTPDAQIYLSGPQVAVAAAITGQLVHPDKLGHPPKVKEPEQFLTDDSMIIPPPPNSENIIIRMGPNIKPLPEFETLPDSFKLKLVLKLEDNISTDDILPGGAKVMALRSNLQAISEHVFALKSPMFIKKAKATDTIAILGGENYGQGSSREHAALAPRYLGVRAILALSFARLYRANLINFGIIPVLVKEEEYNQLETGDWLELFDIRKSLLESAEITIMVPQKNLVLKGTLQFSRREKEILLEGSCLNFHRHRLTENSSPHLTG